MTDLPQSGPQESRQENLWSTTKIFSCQKTYVMISPSSYGIFADPIFIRRNVLINFLHSRFPSKDLNLIPVLSFSDLLRANYHSLTLESDPNTRSDNISLIYSLLTHSSSRLSELDWYYCERIILHFANQSKAVPQHIPFLLKRY